VVGVGAGFGLAFGAGFCATGAGVGAGAGAGLGAGAGVRLGAGACRMGAGTAGVVRWTGARRTGACRTVAAAGVLATRGRAGARWRLCAVVRRVAARSGLARVSGAAVVAVTGAADAPAGSATGT
jgi:hypothetical protein